MSLNRFLSQIPGRLALAIARPEFHPTQAEMLQTITDRYVVHLGSNPVSHPLALFYRIIAAWQHPVDEQVFDAAEFCSFYLMSADLLDDVQDEDLAGKPHERVGPALAINDAVSLLFLALRALERVMSAESLGPRSQRYLQLFNRTSILAVAGQHLDLARKVETYSPADVLAMHQAKTSSIAMITEIAALLAGCDEAMLCEYRTLGVSLTQFAQVQDDIRDIFGKCTSSDLQAGSTTYPIACFMQDAGESEREQFLDLISKLPDTLDDIRLLLYRCGAVDQSANAMEELRERMHEALARTRNVSAQHRCILEIIDTLAESIYTPPELECTRDLLAPQGPWHDRVRNLAASFVRRLAPLGAPVTPLLRPWHLAQWMFDPHKFVIFYPDIEGLPDDILLLQSDLLGIDDLEEVSRIQWEQAPTLLAHEMFHYWRASSGCLTQDYWHEEWAANTLAVAYARQFEPDALRASVALSESVLSRMRNAPDSALLELVASCHEPSSERSPGYGMPLKQMMLVTLEMVRKIETTRPDLTQMIASLLTPCEVVDGVVAA